MAENDKDKAPEKAPAQAVTGAAAAEPVQAAPETGEPDFQIIKPPDTIGAKVRKVSGDVSDLLTMSDKEMAGKKTDFTFAVERELARIQTVFLEVWINEATRDLAIPEILTLTGEITRRAAGVNFTLLARIAELFGKYAADVPPAQQKRAAVESYINAMQVIWTQRLGGNGGEIGARMTTDLVTLNRKAGARS